MRNLDFSNARYPEAHFMTERFCKYCKTIKLEIQFNTKHKCLVCVGKKDLLINIMSKLSDEEFNMLIWANPKYIREKLELQTKDKQ